MAESFEIRPFEECIEKIKYTTKIASQDFKESGRFPIISQEEAFISGYWDNPEDVFHINKPVVIFGDHSRHIKYVDFDFVIGADGVKILSPVKSINAKYFYYFLKWLDIPSLGYSRHYKALKEKSVKVFSETCQQRIVDELDLLTGIIDKKNAQLRDLDALAQSIFYELFGDPSAAFYNQCDSSRKIGDFSKCIAGATPSTKVDSYWNNGIIPWLSSGEVAKGRVFSTETMITQEGYDSCSTRLVPKGSILVAMAGQGKTRGTVGISGIELCTNQSICSIVVNDKIILPDFLYYQLKLLYNELRSISNGDGGRGGLNLKLIQGFSVIVPEIEKQKAFVKRAKVIETQKNLIQDSIVQSQKLLNSRMSQYFG